MPPHRVKQDINLADDRVVDFKKLGIKADVIAESTSGLGTTFPDIVEFDGIVLANGSLGVIGALNAQGDAIFAGTVTWPTADILFNGASSIRYEGSIIGLRKQFTTTAINKTLVSTDGNSFVLVTAADKVITLPATVAGMTFTIAISSAALSSGTGLSISPNSADAIMGNGLTSADDKDLILTGATDAEGDCVTIVGDGIDGWYITSLIGTWSKEA